MKKIGILLILILLPCFAGAEILVKIGILDMEKLVEDFPESNELKKSWDFFLGKKYFLIDFFEKEQDFLQKNNTGATLSEKSNLESKRLLLKKLSDEMKAKKKQDLALLESSKGKELKLKIFRAIKEARRKTGFGMILSSKEEFILYSAKNMNFNPMVLEELTSADKKK